MNEVGSPLAIAPFRIEETVNSNVRMIPEIVMRALRYTCYGDTIGQGVEMWPREKILSRWEDLKRGLVFERKAPYDVGLEKGHYTDDTEMSISVICAIQKEEIPSPDLFAQSFFEVYDAFRVENGGIPRGGYGQIRKIADLPQTIRMNQLKELREKGLLLRNGLPGNGSGMRLLPVLLFVATPEVVLDRLIAQTIWTHNHCSAILTNLVYLEAANALIHQQIQCEEIFDFTLDFLLERGRWQHLFPSLNQCKETLSKSSREWAITVFGDWDLVLQSMINRIKVLNSLDAPLDEKGTNLDAILSTIMKPGAVLADEMLFGTLYCWRWMKSDLNKSPQSHLPLIMRCLSFGGDVDTLLAHVIPVSFLHLENQNQTIKLPDWIDEECKEARCLFKRLTF